MEQNNNTTKERGGKHLNYEERQKLEMLIHSTFTIS